MSNSLFNSVTTLAVLAFATQAAADQITLRPSLRLSAIPAEIHLADIAALEGPAALALADTVIVRVNSEAAHELSLADIRAALDRAGVHWGQVDLVGRSVILRPPAAAPVEPRKPALRERLEPRIVLAAELIDSATVGGAAVRVILSAVNLAPDALQIQLEPRDLPLWDMPAIAGLQFEIQPLGSLSADRTELAVRTWRDGRIESRQSLTIRTLHRVQAATLQRDVSRNRTIDAEDVQLTTAWLPPSQAADAAPLSQAVGRTATTNLEAGQIIQTRHLRDEMIIKRGDRAIVRCAVGGVVIALQADALADGARGQIIEFRKVGQRSTFTAVITGPGEAVVEASR